MSNLYIRILELCEQRGITGYRLCKDAGISPSLMTDLKMGRKEGMSAATADKIASYFGVSVGYLLGTEPKVKTPTPKDERKKQLRSVARLEAADITPEMDKSIADYIDFLLKRRDE